MANATVFRDEISLQMDKIDNVEDFLYLGLGELICATMEDTLMAFVEEGKTIPFIFCKHLKYCEYCSTMFPEFDEFDAFAPPLY